MPGTILHAHAVHPGNITCDVVGDAPEPKGPSLVLDLDDVAWLNQVPTEL